TRQSPVLRRLYPPEPYVEINPADAQELSIRPRQWVVVSSRRGEMRARAFITPCVARGQLFLPMHYKDVNRLTFAAFDPYSRQPSYKQCAVTLRRAENDPAA